MAERYRVRFKEHVDAYGKGVCVTVLSRSASRLIEGSSDREYIVELKKPKQFGTFELALDAWKSSGHIEWEALDTD